MDVIQVSTTYFMQILKSKSVQNGKSWGKDWNISGLEISGKQIFYPLNIV